MQFRDHPGVQGKRDAYPFDPRLLKIEPSYNVRHLDAADERADLDELKASIRHNGVRVPLEVRLIDEDVFVVAGHRRHKAVMELIAEGEDIKSVPVMPEPKYTSDADRIVGLVVSNSGKPLKPLEIVEVVRRLIAYGWEKQQIAQRLGKSASAVSGYLDMIAMPEPVKEQVRENAISATEAAKLVKTLPKGADPSLAADLIKANQEENRRLGVGKTNDHKVTAKTLKRDRQPKAAPNPVTPSAPGPATAAADAAVAAMQTETATERGAFDQKMDAARERVVTLDRPVEIATPSRPDAHAMMWDAVVQFLGRVALVAQDNEIGARDPDEMILAPVRLFGDGERLYRQMIGDEL